MGIYVGTSGWAYKAWQPKFYPSELRQTKFLSFYAERLTAVEVNYTFRHLLTQKTVDNWLAQTPETFRFALKANQIITHFKRLTEVDDALGRFLSSIAPLEEAERLGPVLFQLPPHVKSAPEVLEDFLSRLPRALRPAFEFRHSSWFHDDIYSVLRSHNAALCVAENEDLTTPEIQTADFVYYRFRKPDYSAGERRQLAQRVRRAASGSDAFAFFKHEERPESPLWAMELLNKVQRVAA